ncbi:hypothetical protein [Vibrio nigripulchritudo]|uniref:hypothetical protein n=1 Tax=Vibrio nigripulchritudo TaxID=28173 RepID=UPI00066B8929|nr:hypothetical protein [Vibrio nigripulchritudo]
MDNIDLNELYVSDVEGVSSAVQTIRQQSREILLKDGEEVVGAILTKEQYSWFLDQLDEAQDTSFIEDRADDLEGSISLDDFKKELE